MLMLPDGTVVKWCEARHDGDAAAAFDELDHQRRAVVFIPPVGALAVDQQARIGWKSCSQPAVIGQLDLCGARWREVLTTHAYTHTQLLEQRITRERIFSCHDEMSTASYPAEQLLHERRRDVGAVGQEQGSRGRKLRQPF